MVSNRFALRSTASWGAQSHNAVVSRFASPLHGVPSPTIRWFRIVSRFGAPLHGEPNPTMRSFRVVSCFTGAQSRNFGCANNTYIVCHAMVLCYCVSCGNARNRLMHALRTTKKAPSGIDPSTTFTPISNSQGAACTAFVPSPPPERNVLCNCMCTSSNCLLPLPFGVVNRLPFWCFSGVSIKGDRIKSGCLTPTFPGAHIRAELLRKPCVLVDPHQRRQNEKWLLHGF